MPAKPICGWTFLKFAKAEWLQHDPFVYSYSTPVCIVVQVIFNLAKNACSGIPRKAFRILRIKLVVRRSGCTYLSFEKISNEAFWRVRKPVMLQEFVLHVVYQFFIQFLKNQNPILKYLVCDRYLMSFLSQTFCWFHVQRRTNWN